MYKGQSRPINIHIVSERHLGIRFVVLIPIAIDYNQSYFVFHVPFLTYNKSCRCCLTFVALKELVELTLRTMDQDKDGKISKADFHTTVKKIFSLCTTEHYIMIRIPFVQVTKYPLMLEAFGTCLPSK